MRPGPLPQQQPLPLEIPQHSTENRVQPKDPHWVPALVWEGNPKMQEACIPTLWYLRPGHGVMLPTHGCQAVRP